MDVGSHVLFVTYTPTRSSGRAPKRWSNFGNVESDNVHSQRLPVEKESRRQLDPIFVQMRPEFHGAHSVRIFEVYNNDITQWFVSVERDPSTYSSCHSALPRSKKKKSYTHKQHRAPLLEQTPDCQTCTPVPFKSLQKLSPFLWRWSRSAHKPFILTVVQKVRPPLMGISAVPSLYRVIHLATLKQI